MWKAVSSNNSIDEALMQREQKQLQVQCSIASISDEILCWDTLHEILGVIERNMYVLWNQGDIFYLQLHLDLELNSEQA